MPSQEKTLMLGNTAVARGLYEAGCHFVSSYPGTPSTEITEEVAKYKEIYAEWAPNEKVAAEAAYGASVAGARAFAGMKHVGLNVAADLLFSASYAGVNGGFVMVVADDQGMHSSQNEQDSRHFARAAKVPMLEPADSQDCVEYARLAFEISEEYDTPVLLRLSTRISHSQSLVATRPRREIPLKNYEKDPRKYIMTPANAQKRHPVVEERTKALTAAANGGKYSEIIPGDRKIGVVAAGIAYQYAREALGERATYLKLALVHPLPMDLLRRFAAEVDALYVIEELDPFIEEQLRAAGIACTGKALFSPIGEYSALEIRRVILGEPGGPHYTPAAAPPRPPVLCAGCPHRGLFTVLNRMKLTVSGDIGCYTLGSAPPLNAMDTTINMGASVTMLHGRNTVRPEEAGKSVAVIGDSTFLHSGITGLINAVYNNSPSTIIIADNSITGMTGHQNNPATGCTLQGQRTTAVDLEALCRSCGVRRVVTVDPYNMPKLEAVLKEELAAAEPSVVITRRPCALLKTVKHQKPYIVNEAACQKCRACMRIGCPAISFQTGTARIDVSLCVGCGLCKSVCKFNCIAREEVDTTC